MNLVRGSVELQQRVLGSMSKYQDRLLRVLTHIHDNPAEDLSLDRLADIAAMSRFHWHRVFQAMTGETCAQAVRRVRIYRAASWLLHSSSPIADVAKRVGYRHPGSFARTFKDEIGMSPEAFRKAGRPVRPSGPSRIGDFQMFPIEKKTLPARRAAALMHVGPYEESDACFQKMLGLTTQHNLWPNVRGMIGVHYSDPNVTPKAELKMHAGVILADGCAVSDELEEVRLEGGAHAVLTYKGPYTSIKVAYDYLFGKWLPETESEPADSPCYEVYLNSPNEVAPAELLTEICLPLKG